MSEPKILAGTRTVDESRLWRSTVWVVLGVLTVVVGRTLATLLASAGGVVGALVFAVGTLVALLVGVFFVLKGLVLLLEAVGERQPGDAAR
jgi:hypothetical protein